MATFEEDALAAQLIPLLGADSCMWASDYPHTDSTFPNSRHAIEEVLGALPADGSPQDHRDELRAAVRLRRCLITAQGAIDGFDHVSLPMQDTDAMVAFYRALGFDVAEHRTSCPSTSATR